VSTYPNAALLLSASQPRHFPEDSGAEVAFAGRSNAGKSSAINALTARRSLARTAKTPGRTRLLNFFELTPGCRIVDLPGYGYAEASATRASLRGLFLIVDSRRGLLDGDEGLIAWAQAVRCPVHVLLSKSDKLKRAELTRTLAAAQLALAVRATVQAFSAVDGTGLEEARRQLHHWFQKIKGPGG